LEGTNIGGKGGKRNSDFDYVLGGLVLTYTITEKKDLQVAF